VPRPLPLALLSLLLCGALRADEGMWTYDNLPLKRIQEKYGFAPDAQWVRKLQLSTIRFSGGTGAFVSRDGLVITNHHVGRGSIAQLSTRERDLVQNGFVAATREQELKVPGMSLSILVSMENVTERVRTAGTKAKDPVKGRKDELDRIRTEQAAKTGLQCDGVTLYQGGEYWIYRYKRFQDVRLVMAPELQVANFGGDDDNYSYPRWDLDFSLFRIYEGGKPYTPEAFLPFATDPLRNGDLTFISGQPGTTFRQQTLAQMRYARDLQLPFQIRSAERQKKALLAFSTTGDEPRRLALEAIYGIDNGRKRNQARLLGLQSAAALAKVEASEKELRAKVAADPKLQARVGGAWALIEKAVARQKALLKETSLVNTRNSSILGHALELVRIHGELAKPADKRLSEFRDERAARQRLLSPRAIHKSIEQARLAAGLTEALEELGRAHPFVQAMLGNRTPEEVAKAAVEGTQLHDLAARKALLEGDAKAVATSDDPMLVLARRLDPIARKLQLRNEAEVTNVINEQAARIAEARFQIYGKDQYPDATGTLRMGYGPVMTYNNGVGTKAQPFTTMFGLFDRHEGWGGNAAAAEGGQWTLPQRWLDRRDKLDLSTPFNFIYACDTVGGNSGSPVVNTKGHFVGINFDSVYEGQGGYYVYDQATKRAVAVDARAILESLAKVFDAPHLVKELRGQQ
jgi:hypothetical protein